MSPDMDRSVVQMESMEASKPSDFGSYPNRSAIALWCNGNTSGSDSEIIGSKSPFHFSVGAKRTSTGRPALCEGCFGSLV